MIRLNVFLQVSEENREELLSAATRLVENSLTEKGCIAYDLFQSTTRGGVFMICETWATEEALAAHKQSEHYREYGPCLRQLAAMKVERFEF